MKKATKVCTVVLIGLVFAALTGCATGPRQSGFLGDYYSKLEPGPEGGVKYRWLKPGVDFSKYHKLMIDSVIFYYAPDSDDKGIDAEQMKELTDAFNAQIVTELKGKYPVVAEPGPDVARLRIALTDVKKSKPVVSAVTSVVPVGIGVSAIRKGSGGAWSGSGATSAELMAVDSMTNEVIAVAEDEQTAGYFDRFSQLGSAKEAFKFWVERIKLFIDEAHAGKK